MTAKNDTRTPKPGEAKAIELTQNIVAMFQGHGFSLRKIGQMLDIHPSEVTRMKAGDRPMTTTQLERVAQFLEVPLPLLVMVAEEKLLDPATTVPKAWAPLMEEAKTLVKDALVKKSPKEPRAPKEQARTPAISPGNFLNTDGAPNSGFNTCRFSK